MAKPKGSASSRARAYTRERANFQALLLENPNYFGNFPGSKLKPVLELIGHTGYEELTCVGYNPDHDELEATVQIKRATGYGGDLCSAGSTEYVRFYVDYGAGWEDVGLAAFNAHDIPNSTDCADRATKPLSYVVTVPHQPKRSFCGNPILPLVRAVLSWSAMPPAGEPDWPQVWGNTVDRHVQIKPRPPYLIDIIEALGGKKLKIPPELEYAELQPIQLPDPPEPPLEELAELYANPVEGAVKGGPQAVEPHRFGLQELKAASTVALVSQPAVVEQYAQWKELGFDLGEVLGWLEKTKGDVSYEELDCLGLDYNREWLTASLTIKRQTGYNGSLCQKGSLEYVAFWADWEDRCEWEYLSSVALSVHDIASIPADGLRYWVGLPVASRLSEHRGSCEKPKIARVRAVLCWNEPPSTTNPDAIPHWGNRLDAHVEIRPKEPLGTGPEIDAIGGVGVVEIDRTGNGMTKQGAVFAETGSPVDPYVIGPLAGGGTGSTRLCPFGGRVAVNAAVRPEFAASGYKYRLVVRRQGSADPPTAVTASFPTTSGLAPVAWRTPDPEGYVDYLDPSQNVYNVLGWWYAGGLGDDLWEVRLEMTDAAFNPLGATIWNRIQLDNTRPEADVSIASGGDCRDFDKGEAIAGTISATDAHFGHFDLYTLPASLSPPNPSTARASWAEAPNPAPWELKTEYLTPCGYVIKLDVYDRTIVDSWPGVHNGRSDDTGFCLRAKPS